MKKRRYSAIFRKLQEDLRYWQTQARLDARSLSGSRAKVKQIAAQMREEKTIVERRLDKNETQ